MAWLLHFLYVHIQIQIPQFRLKFQIYVDVYLCMCLPLSLCGGEVPIICIYVCMTTCHYVEIQISSKKYFYRVALRMKQVKGK